MPKVLTQKAGKDYPKEGIKRGDVYYSWSFFRQPTQRSATYPKPSQLCNNVLSGAYAAREALEDEVGSATCPEDVATALSDCAQAVRDVVDEIEDQLSNLEDAFQGGSPMIDEKTEQKDALEAYADELESAETDVQNLDVEDYRAEGSKATTFDELDDDEKEQMMEAARETADIELEV